MPDATQETLENAVESPGKQLLNWEHVDSSNSGSCAICGQRNLYSRVVCEACGARLPWVNAALQPQTSSIALKGGPLNPWLQIASFAIPIVGLVLYFFYRTDKPTKARSAMRAAAWGMLFNLVLTFARAMSH